jgi:hypothetical protein
LNESLVLSGDLLFHRISRSWTLFYGLQRLAPFKPGVFGEEKYFDKIISQNNLLVEQLLIEF